MDLGTGIVVGAKKTNVLDASRHRSPGRGMFLTGYFALPVSGGALIASCVIDVGVAAMQLAVAQYQDATNVLGHTIAGTSIQRIEPVPNHDCFHTRSPTNIADAGMIVPQSHNTGSAPSGDNSEVIDRLCQGTFQIAAPTPPSLTSAEAAPDLTACLGLSCFII